MVIDDQIAFRLAKEMLSKEITVINVGVIEHQGKKFDLIAQVREHKKEECHHTVVANQECMYCKKKFGGDIEIVKKAITE